MKRAPLSNSSLIFFRNRIAKFPKLEFIFLYILFFFPLYALFADWRAELGEKIREGKFPSWMIEQIEADLAPFRAGISSQLIEETISSYQAYCSSLLVRYDLINQQLFITADDETRKSDRFELVTQALQELANLAVLPNVTLVVSLHDSFEVANFNKPLLVFAKHREHSHILMPDCYSLGDLEPFLSQKTLGARAYPWHHKINRAFWRGAATDGHYTLSNYTTFPRYKLVELSASRPDLVDAKLTGYQQCENEAVRKKLKKYNGGVCSIYDHMQYKYQILIDGNTSAWTRAIWQLFSNCVIFKQDSPNIQWYYRAISPYVHYIPFANDVSDLIEKIEWAKKHDDRAFKIMRNAQDFALYNLQKSDRYLYLYLLIRLMGQLS